MKRLCSWGAFLCLTLQAPGQEPPVPQPQVQRIVIDGSKEPHRIPDNIAWLMLFRLLAGDPLVLPNDIRVAYLKSSGLNVYEIGWLVRAANEVHRRLEEMEKSIKSSGLDMAAKTQALRSGRDAIINDVVRELLIEKFSVERGDTLLRYLREDVKRRISITRDSVPGADGTGR